MALTSGERRGALTAVLLLSLGAGYDLWRAEHPSFHALRSIGAEPAAALPETAAAGSASGPTPGVVTGMPLERLELNRAGAADLDRLPGIGPVLAARIVDYRRRHGSFARVEELLAVQGIGPRLLERLRPHLRITNPLHLSQGGPLP